MAGPRVSAAATAAAVVVLAALVSAAAGVIVENKEITTSLQGGILTSFQTFGYRQNGTVAFVPPLSYATKKLALALCRRREWTDLISLKSQFSVLCNQEANETVVEYEGAVASYHAFYATREVCELTSVSLLSEELWNYQVQSTDQYTFAIINCDPHRSIQKIHLSYTLEQPDGNHLSLGSQPNETIYTWLSVLWLSYLVFLLVQYIDAFSMSHIYTWRDGVTNPAALESAALTGNNGARLHVLLLIVVVLKAVDCYVLETYWQALESSGTQSFVVDLLNSILFAVSECAFFRLLLLVAKGWKITRYELHPEEARETSYAFIIPLCTLLFFSIYNEGYYFLSMMLLYFFLLPKIFHSLHLNITGVQTRLLIIEDWLIHAEMEDDSEEMVESRAEMMEAIRGVFEQKLQVFVVLKKAILSYLIAIFLCNCLKVLIPWQYDWINTILSEGTDAVMIMVVGTLIQPMRTRKGVFFLYEGNFLLSAIYFEEGVFSSENASVGWEAYDVPRPRLGNPDAAAHNKAVSKMYAVNYPDQSASSAVSARKVALASKPNRAQRIFRCTAAPSMAPAEE